MTTILTHQDRRREAEVLAYQVQTFPNLSADGALTEIAPHLDPITRAITFDRLVAATMLRDALTKACETQDAAQVSEVLADPDIQETGRRAAGAHWAILRSTARLVTAIRERDWEVLEGRDLNVDGARQELHNIRDGYYTAVDYYGSAELLEQSAERKLKAALGNFAFVQEHLLERRLELVTVAAWRYTDRARMRLTGGAA